MCANLLMLLQAENIPVNFSFLMLWEWSRLVICGPPSYALRNWAGVFPKGPPEEKVDCILHDLGQEWKAHLSWVSEQTRESHHYKTYWKLSQKRKKEKVKKKIKDE